jgi:hypothetical protein
VVDTDPDRYHSCGRSGKNSMCPVEWWKLGVGPLHSGVTV